MGLFHPNFKKGYFSKINTPEKAYIGLVIYLQMVQ
jgi:hypothetical protein